MRSNSIRKMAATYVRSQHESAARILGSRDSLAKAIIDLKHKIGVYQHLRDAMPKSNKWKARREGIEVLIAQLKIMLREHDDSHNRCRVAYINERRTAEQLALDESLAEHDWIDWLAFGLRELCYPRALWRMFIGAVKFNRWLLRAEHQNKTAGTHGYYHRGRILFHG